MHQNGGAGVARRVKPGQPLDVALGFLTDIDDDVLAVVLHALQLQPQLFAHGAAATVAGDQPIGADGLHLAVGVNDLNFVALTAFIVDFSHRFYRAIPPYIHQIPVVFGSFMRILLRKILLNVYHGRKSLRGVVGHLEVQHLGIAVITTPTHPRQAFVHQRLVRTHPAQNLLRASRHTNRTATGAVRRVVFNHHAAYAKARQ